MRQFSIHKVNKPMLRRKEGEAARQGDADSSQKLGGYAGGDFEGAADEFTTGAEMSSMGGGLRHIGGEQPSLLTAEE